MTVKCTKYPQLHIYDLGVKFENGEAAVTDKKALESLKKMDESYGFEYAGDDGGKE
ncbi:MAG: hypothetical protein LBV27_07260 [Oscillospiraceae bacterium]|jgi:hypothetical protein|nr:hypothetical protein [Oscillospiraceae bacterium]